MSKTGKKLLITLLIAALLFSINIHPGHQEVFASSSIVLKDYTNIASGAVLKEYFWDSQHGPVEIHVIEVDLDNPYIELDTILGKGRVTERSNVSAMARDTGAVAAVNGDFYNMRAEGAPIGPMVMSQQLVCSPIKNSGLLALGISSSREAYIESFNFTGKVTAPGGVEFPLTGLNKTYYLMNPDNSHSHKDRLHLYNDLWGKATRGEDGLTEPTEVLVEKGIVIDISEGEYFDFAVPQGKKILRGHGKAADFLLENLRPGDPVDLQYAMSPDREWNMVIGGHSLLVEKGETVPYTRDISALEGLRARTAAGISRDRQTLYLVGVEGRTSSSKGLRLGDLAAFMKHIGSWKALNMDGGGSATMASRPLGEWQATRVYTPEQFNERLVVNALGIYSTAPKGELEGLILSGSDLILVGEEASYQLKAYDEYYNPVDPRELPVTWQATNNAGDMEENVFTGKTAGTAEIKAQSGSISASMPIEVAGKGNIQKLSLSTPTKVVEKGMQLPLTLKLTTTSGRTREIPWDLVDWRFDNLEGEVSPEGLLTIKEMPPGEKGLVIVDYQDSSDSLELEAIKEKEMFTFDTLDILEFASYPGEVKGDLSLTPDPLGPEDSRVTRLEYDFSNARGLAAAYLKLREHGIFVNRAQGMTLEVYGNKGNQNIKVLVEHDQGKPQRVDLVSRVDWEGWRTLELDFEEAGLKDVCCLQRIYVLSHEDEELGIRDDVKGELLFKNLNFKYPPDWPPEIDISLNIGKTQMLVNQEKREMDVAPLIKDSRTLVPLRFVSEALEAEVQWDNEERKVTVIQDMRKYEFWVGEDKMKVNDKKINMDVAPIIVEDRTMIPVRFLGEAMELLVGWEQETRQVTLSTR